MLLPFLFGACASKEFEGDGSAGEGNTATGGKAGSAGTGQGGGANGGGSGGGSPTDVSGTYTVAITVVSRESNFTSCPLSGVTVGATSTGVTVTISQSGAIVTASLDWLTSLGVANLLGNNVSFAGSVTGNAVEMVAFGTKSYTEGTCTYTMNATMNGTLTGNALEGTTRYELIPATGTVCRDLVCEGAQDFSGSRPPR